MTAQPPTYAAGTTVSPEKSRAELDTLLGKHGATSRGVFSDGEKGVAGVAFCLASRRYKVEVPMPTRESIKAHFAKHGWPRNRSTLEILDAAVVQGERERWRGLLLLVKAKLETVRMGVSTIEREFLANLVLPNGDTGARYLAAVLERGGSGPLQLPERT